MLLRPRAYVRAGARGACALPGFRGIILTASTNLQNNQLPPPRYPSVFGTAVPSGDILARLRPSTIPRELLLEEDEKEVIRPILPPAH